MKLQKKLILLLWIILVALPSNAVFAEDGLLSDNVVGESSNEKRFSVRISPLVLILSIVNVEADIKIMDNLTVGPMITYWSIPVENIDGWDDFTDATVTGYGVRANWYFSNAMEGGYISPYFKRWGFSLTDVFNNSGSASASFFGAILGYQFLWDSINMNTEIGFGAFVGDLDVEVKNSSGSVVEKESVPLGGGGLVLDWTIGFSF